MDNNWASENIQTIRTLMERSAIYRRALAPIMIVTGLIGLVASGIFAFIKIESSGAFVSLWILTGLVAFVTALLLVRRQALQEAEPFWSPPTRRVWQALLPNFVAGLMLGLFFIVPGLIPSGSSWILPPIWMLFYGGALHAAGFFMKRSMRWFGWGFLTLGLAVLFGILAHGQWQSMAVANYVMAAFFGALHLVFGIYLSFTEGRKNEA